MAFQRSGNRYLLFTGPLSYSHTFIISKTGKLYSMGSNHSKECWISDVSTNLSVPTICDLFPKYKKPIQVACGNNHTLVLTSDHKVYSSGNNEHGQLSLGNSFGEGIGEVLCLSKEKIIEVAAGTSHSVFISPTAVFASGKNQNHQCSEGNTKNILSAKKINTNGIIMEKCGCGNDYTILLSKNKELFFMGYLFSNVSSNKLKKITFGNNNEKVVDFTSGFSSFFIIGSSGKVYGMGENEYGEQGYKPDYSVRGIKEMTEIKGFSDKNIVSIKSGGFHLIALSRDGNTYGVGYPSALGNRSGKQDYNPVLLKKDIVQVECAGDGSFMFDKFGTCWVAGDNGEGQLGLGNGNDDPSTWERSNLISKIIKFESRNTIELFPFLKKIFHNSLLVDIKIINV